MQFANHLRTAAWSISGKALNVVLGFAFILAQKCVGESYFGEYMTVQAFLTTMYMLSDGLALQGMVNFGMDESRRSEAMATSALLHTIFISLTTILLYTCRSFIADLADKPQLVTNLTYLPLWSGAFLLRTYFLKIAQLRIDTKGAFFIEASWIGTTALLIEIGRRTGKLATSEHLFIIGIIAAGVSSLTGLVLYFRQLQFVTKVDKHFFRTLLRFGLTQFGSASTLALQSQGDVILLTRFASSAIIGNYSAAKTFYRGFEALRDAGSLFVYPAVARLAVQKRFTEIVPLVEKMMAFMCLVIVPIVLFVWLGPTDSLFNILYKGKYTQASTVFRVLSLGAPAIPFAMNIIVLYGLGVARRSLHITLIVALSFFGTGVVLIWQFGIIGAAVTMGLNLVILGILATRELKKQLPELSLSRMLGRWRDVFDFIQRLMRRNSNK